MVVDNLSQTTVVLEEENLGEEGTKPTLNLDSLRGFVLGFGFLFSFVLFCFGF